MVINNNEQEFTGKTLQGYLDWRYPTKEMRERIREIDADLIYKIRSAYKGIAEKLEGGELDLSEYVSLEKLIISRSGLTKLTLGNKPKLTYFDCTYNELTDLDVSKCSNLTTLYCGKNKLTSIDFLNHLPNFEKLIQLAVSKNKLTGNLEFFSRFVNLTKLLLGNDGGASGNSFYGSLEPIKNLSQLTCFCIEGTDIDEGLEYVPSGLAERTKKSPKAQNFIFDCTAGEGKVKKIQEQLRPFNYDIEA
ncbi:4963_t:CDS:1 [Entrophospora sp. SA101]|nr:9138_t:CDS:1 [Entrophospora sp. SA101]CAJ0833507.1 4963_t:CDS:1 [Entrophospora sp. SA101]